MRIIEIEPLSNGAHRNQNGVFTIIPEGYALIPDDVSIPETFPFVNVTALDGVVTAMTEGVFPPVDLEATKANINNTINLACEEAIINGCDVTLSDGTTGHISLTAEDQINLSTALSVVQGGATGYPYHLDGSLCSVYSSSDIVLMATAATSHKLYHTTYCNHLHVWINRCTHPNELNSITYGATLPDDLADNMASIMTAMGTDNA